MLICNNSYYPGDGFVYSIYSAQGTSTLRRLELIHMSDAWKNYMLAHYEVKRSASYSPARPQAHCGLFN